MRVWSDFSRDRWGYGKKKKKKDGIEIYFLPNVSSSVDYMRGVEEIQGNIMDCVSFSRTSKRPFI